MWLMVDLCVYLWILQMGVQREHASAGVGEQDLISSDTDWFSQVEEHPVDGWCIGNMRLYINTVCISDSSHIIISQYCSVICRPSPVRREIHLSQRAIPINQPILVPNNCYDTADTFEI